MRFDFTEDQYALREGAREFFAGESTADHVRAMWEHETGCRHARWKQLADTGFVGLCVPEEHDGLGMDAVDLVLLLEAAGYAGLPEPLLETAGVVAPVLARHADAGAQQAWLPGIAAGDVIATVAMETGAEGHWLVPQAHVADLLLVVTDDEVHALGSDRFTAEVQPTVDRARRVARVSAHAGHDTRVGAADAAVDARVRAAGGSAAVLNGVSRRLLDMTVDYVKQREQFSRLVGSFQAVKHKLAETLLAVETSLPAGWYAAYAIAHAQQDRGEAASVAKAYASDAAAKASSEALQCHGGIGFTWEHDLHLWLKRASALERSYGTASAHRKLLATTLLD